MTERGWTDPRAAARKVLALIQKNEPIRRGDEPVFLAPLALTVSMTAIADAAVRYSHALGADDSDEESLIAYAWVAGVLAGHHVTADPRVVSERVS